MTLKKHEPKLARETLRSGVKKCRSNQLLGFNMKRIYTTALLAALLIFSGCASPNLNLENHETLYKNPDPAIEALHVEAFNYDTGTGVARNQAKANKLYLQAAKAGDPRSMMNYSINRFYGDGIQSDPIDAFCWIDKARLLTQHSADMKLKWRVRSFYDELDKKLTSEQKKEARSRQ
jgi:hypothetical protein